AIRRRAGDQRNIRRAFENSFTFLLRHAAQYAKLFSLRLKTLVVVETMKDFLLRFVANGTGVVEDQAGFFDRRDLAISLRQQRAQLADLLRQLRGRDLVLLQVSLRGPRTGDALLIENGAYPAVDGNGDGLVARTEDLIAAERAQDVAIGGFNAVGALHELHRR